MARSTAKVATAAKAEAVADKPAKEERTEKVSTPREAPEEVSRPVARPSSNAPIIIGALVVVAGALAALWFFVLREDAVKSNGTGSAGSAIVENTGSDLGSAVATMPGSDVGSAGSAVEAMGSGSAVAMAGSAVPAANTVDTVITSPTAKATISVEGQSGPAPFTAKLEKGKA